MARVPIDACPGLSPSDLSLLKNMGIDHAFYGRVVDTLHFYVYAVPLYRLTDRIYAGFMPEIGDPCIIEVRDDEVVIYDQYEASESLLQLKHLRPKILRYFNSTPHTLQEAVREVQKIFGKKPVTAIALAAITAILSVLLHIPVQ